MDPEALEVAGLRPVAVNGLLTGDHVDHHLSAARITLRPEILDVDACSPPPTAGSARLHLPFELPRGVQVARIAGYRAHVHRHH